LGWGRYQISVCWSCVMILLLQDMVEEKLCCYT
jgi:hypothetical protein